MTWSELFFSSGIGPGFSGVGGLSFNDLVRIFYSPLVWSQDFLGEGVYPLMTWSGFVSPLV